jgi:predicted ATPase
MRDANRTGPPDPLGCHGEDLSRAWHAIKNEHPAVFAEMLRSLRQDIPEIADLRTPIDRFQQTQVATTEDGLASAIPASSLSDGVLCLLGLLAVALHPSPSACVLVEEPEAHLHQGLMPRVADLLRFLAARTTVIAATQSPALVNEMYPPSLVVVEKRDAGTVVRRLPQRSKVLMDALRVMGLGEAWMNGFFGGVPVLGGGRGADDAQT